MLTLQGPRAGAARWALRAALVAAAVLFAAIFAGGAGAQPLEPRIVGVLHGDVLGYGFTPDSTATVSIFAAPGGALLWSAVTPTDGDGALRVWEADHGQDLAPGMSVKAADDSTGIAKDVTLVPVTLDSINPTAKLVRGTAPPGSTVSVSGNPAPGVWPTLEVVAGTDGRWTADFGAAGLETGISGNATVYDGDGDGTSAMRNAPSINVTTSYGALRFNLGVDGNDFTPNATVDVQILGPGGGPVLWSGSLPTDNEGRPGMCCVVPELTQVAIAPGMVVVVTDPATTIAKAVTIVPLTIDLVDPRTDTVSGTASPGADVQVGEWGDFTDVVADAEGRWTVARDVTWTSWVTAVRQDGDGDSMATNGSPPVIAAVLTDDVVRGENFSLDAPVGVQILTSGGTTAWSGTVTTVGRSFVIGRATHGLELAPGMVIRVSDAATGMVKELTIVPLTIDLVDPVLDVAAGTAAPGTTVGLSATWPGEGGGQVAEGVPVDPSGHWSYDFRSTPGSLGIDDDTIVAVGVGDAEFDGTEAYRTATPGAIADLKADVAALALPAAQAAMLTTKLDDAVAKLDTGNTTAALGNLNAFVQKVEALVRSGRLAPAAGDALIAAAKSIAAAIAATG